MGDRKSIKIWTNKWLNDRTSLRVISQTKTLSTQSTMTVLIDPQTSAWREELVRQIFIPVDVHSILSIHLSIHIPHVY